MSVRELEIPRTLPVDNFSASSVNLYLRCPERWRRRYVENEYEPPSGALILGSSVHAAEAISDHAQIESGSRLSTVLVQEAFSDEFAQRSEREEVDWGSDQPGELKDLGVGMVAAYDRDVARSLEPFTVERGFQLDFAGVDWGFRGYIDLEEGDGAIVDRKTRAKKMSAADADLELAVAPYLLARRAEGNPTSQFRFHALVKAKRPYAEIVATTRTDVQLEAFVDRVYAIAAEIGWRMESGVWSGAVPGSYWCSEKWCGFWPSCPMGGMR